MLAVNKQLDDQYSAGRIRGTDYASVMLGSIQGVMTNTTTYLLGQLLIDEKKAKLEADTSLTAKQELRIDNEIAMLELEQLKLKFEIEELYPLQKIKTTAEIALINAQIAKLDQEVINLIAQASLLGKQEDKIDQEILFLIAKVRTEEANTLGGKIEDGSLLKGQLDLLQAQKLGFAGDLQIKAAKLYADYDAVYQSVQEATAGQTLGGFADPGAGQTFQTGAQDVIAKALAVSDAINLI
jgi:hypothetical protein